MGKTLSTQLKIRNSTSSGITTSVSRVRPKDWFGPNNPLGNMHGVKIAPGSEYSREEVINARSTANVFTLTMVFSNGKVLVFRIDQGRVSDKQRCRLRDKEKNIFSFTGDVNAFEVKDNISGNTLTIELRDSYMYTMGDTTRARKRAEQIAREQTLAAALAIEETRRKAAEKEERKKAHEEEEKTRLEYERNINVVTKEESDEEEEDEEDEEKAMRDMLDEDKVYMKRDKSYGVEGEKESSRVSGFEGEKGQEENVGVECRTDTDEVVGNGVIETGLEENGRESPAQLRDEYRTDSDEVVWNGVMETGLGENGRESPARKRDESRTDEVVGNGVMETGLEENGRESPAQLRDEYRTDSDEVVGNGVMETGLEENGRESPAQLRDEYRTDSDEVVGNGVMETGLEENGRKSAAQFREKVSRDIELVMTSYREEEKEKSAGETSEHDRNKNNQDWSKGEKNILKESHF